jgi:hypothetical protein
MPGVAIVGRRAFWQQVAQHPGVALPTWVEPDPARSHAEPSSLLPIASESPVVRGACPHVHHARLETGERNWGRQPVAMSMPPRPRYLDRDEGQLGHVLTHPVICLFEPRLMATHHEG